MQPHDSRLMAAPSGQAASISWFWYFTRFTSVTSRPSWILKRGSRIKAQPLIRCLTWEGSLIDFLHQEELV